MHGCGGGLKASFHESSWNSSSSSSPAPLPLYIKSSTQYPNQPKSLLTKVTPPSTTTKFIELKMMAIKPHRDSDARAIIEKGAGWWEFKPRAFNIVWGNDSRYWVIPTEIESNQPAELRQVSWLEVTSSIQLQVGKKYNISFKISMKPDAYGWSGVSVYLMAKVGRKGKYTSKKLSLPEQRTGEPSVTVVPSEPLRVDVVPQSNSNAFNDTRLYFGLYEVWSGKWKGGLLIYGATVKEVN